MAVDHALFAQLYRAGLPRADIARQCGCHVAYVSPLAIRLGLGPLKLAAVPRPERQPKAGHPILATGGHWAALADYARRHGLTMAEAQRQWHRHRARQA